MEAFGTPANENVLERLALLREGQAKLRQVSPGLRKSHPPSTNARTHSRRLQAADRAGSLHRPVHGGANGRVRGVSDARQAAHTDTHTQLVRTQPECAVAVQEMRLDQMRQEGKNTKRKARKSSGVLASCLLASLRVRGSLLCCAW